MKHKQDHDHEAEDMAQWGTKGKPGCVRDTTIVMLIGVGWGIFFSLPLWG